jgi:hypothetical protein
MEHPITPPPFELVNQWHKEACKDPYNGGAFIESKVLKYIATAAAQWGADQELEACCEWLRSQHHSDTWPSRIRAARRPKPPSLKEQALAVLDDCADHLDGAHENTIRRALEALPND